MAKTNHERGRDQFQKLGFYRISLVFAILGLSIQTATFGTFAATDISELLAWLVLLVSGVVGLSVIQKGVELDLLRGVIGDQGEVLARLRGDLQSGQRNALRRYNFHVYSFVAGLVLLMFARGWPPIVSIYERMTSTGC